MSARTASNVAHRMTITGRSPRAKPGGRRPTRWQAVRIRGGTERRPLPPDGGPVTRAGVSECTGGASPCTRSVSGIREGSFMAARATAATGGQDWIEGQFKVRASGSTIGTEVRGGVTNFLVMSYILVVNAIILSSAGIPFPAVVAATALMAALFTGGMALYANYPYAGAAGLGINAVVAFGLV